MDENRGLISSLEEFEQFPLGKIKGDISVHELMAQDHPEEMKVVVKDPQGRNNDDA